ncbi:MBL fold metallo-hydrolase [Paenarthrobacter sp. NPDC089714]|uniref:MBL fold metallo-hydrolase n=1 Tax=Paenarthrobacter sp. NPDC089714 TaxID=3364377 RepID=UPI0037F15B66
MKTHNPEASTGPAQPWYSLTRTAHDLINITEPHVHPTLQANIWWLQGEQDIVIDAGLGVVPLKASVPELFSRNPLLVLTHAHLDHSGGAHEFDDIAIHKNEAPSLERPLQASLETSELYPALGLPYTEETSKHVMLSKLPSTHYQLGSYRLLGSKPTRLLKHGDTITTATHELQVLATPGHSPGSICLLDRVNKRLYTGDVIYEGNLLDQIAGASRSDYLQTMEQLLQLDFELAMPGHGTPLTRRQVEDIATSYLSLHGA